MAVTRLTDVVVPEVFLPHMLKKTAEKSAIFQSGILRNDANMKKFLAGGGRTENVPFWHDLSSAEPNISSDDPASEASPQKITGSKDVAVRHNRNQAWSDAYLVSELSGDDPMKRILSRVSDYWSRAYQRQLVSSLKGVFADNAANDAADMRHVIATDDAGAPADSELISADAVIDAKQTMGDAAEELSVLIMHSVPYSRLQKQNLIDFIPNSEGKVSFPTYLGYRIVVDDGCPAIQGTNRISYSTYLVSRGAFAWAEHPPKMAVEVERKPSQGDGGGVEELWTRRQFVLHPYGVKWTDASVAGQSPTNSEIENAANWDRVYGERKQVGLVELVTNG